MSGIFTPIESMPAWARYFDLVNPVAWLISINRMIMLTGSGLSDISTEILALTAIAAGFLVLAIAKYRKTSA
jgi:ABC-2 type transport system permease protein